MKTFFLIAALLSLPLATEANSVSGIQFTPSELQQASRGSKVLSETASTCLKRFEQEHNQFFTANNYSKFFGDRHWRHKSPDHRKFALLRVMNWKLIMPDSPYEGENYKRLKEFLDKTEKDEAKKKALLEPTLKNYKQFLSTKYPAVLAELLKYEPVLTAKEKELNPISCVGLALHCMSEGFEKAGMKNTWKKIYTYLTRPDIPADATLSGIDLQKVMIDLGWKAYYWNPEPATNTAADCEDRILNPLDPINKPEKKWDHTWGNHAYYHAIAHRTGKYYGVPLHDRRLLVNFRNKVPVEFSRAPFFLGTAHAGYHVFPGFYGTVIEAHSKRDLNDKSNLETSRFDPANQEGGGGPIWTKIEKYRSGVIVVPPGYIQVRPGMEKFDQGRAYDPSECASPPVANSSTQRPGTGSSRVIRAR